MSQIVIVQRTFPKYRKDILSKVKERLNILLLHSYYKNGVHQESAEFAKKIKSIKFASKESNLFLNAFPNILRFRPKVIVYEYSIGIASLYPTYWLARLLGIKFILWGHGYDHTKGFNPKDSIADRLRIYIAKKADAVIFYGSTAKKHFSNHMSEEKLFIAYNCLNTQNLSSIRDNLENEGRENIKKRIGFTHTYNLIFIGRILKSKKPELLLNMCQSLLNQYPGQIGIHYVGDGPHLNSLKQIVKTKGLEEQVVFHGAIHEDKKTGELLFCSELMIMPGYVGLSVNHAFNFDCPVVTFKQKADGPFHSPEIEYLVDQTTGFIAEDHTEEALSKIVHKYLSDEGLQKKMKSNIREVVTNVCSVENFVVNYTKAIDYALQDH
jgi:glycosyltransferase involved in cell wall biosynthesis